MKINNTNLLYLNTFPKKSSNLYYSPISFTSKCNIDDKSFECFENWAKETGFIRDAKLIIQNPKNVIGSGFEGKVYAIPNSENWVIKEYFRSNILQKVEGQPNIVELTDISPKLNIGQAIAKVNLLINDRYVESIFIHKKQKGKSIGINSLLLKTVSDGTADIHLKSLETIANLPQDSFNFLINDINTISSLGYKIDGTTPNNILLDSSNNRLNFVDIADKDTDSNTQYSEVLFSLLGASFSERFFNSDRSDFEKSLAMDFSQIIIQKFITAMNTINARFSKTYNYHSLINSTVFKEYLKRNENK